MDNDLFFLLYTALIAFFGATAKEANDISKANEKAFIFAMEVLSNGFAGWMTGLLLIKRGGYRGDIVAITICAGIGGFLGITLLHYIVKLYASVTGKGKDIDLDKK